MRNFRAIANSLNIFQIGIQFDEKRKNKIYPQKYVLYVKDHFTWRKKWKLELGESKILFQEVF